MTLSFLRPYHSAWRNSIAPTGMAAQFDLEPE
jgi:hypothetical protein